MTFELWNQWRFRRFLETAGEGGAGGAGAGDGGGGEGAGGTGAGAGQDGQGDAGGDGGAAAEKPWWEGAGFDEKQRQLLTAKGLTVDDPVAAMAKLTTLYGHAESRLGKPADQLMDRPGKDGDVSDWLRANGDLFGIPEKADGYDIKPPESWPKDAKWDSDLEAAARTKGHELGLNARQMQGMVELYAGAVAKLDAGASQDLEQASAQLQSELQADWGDTYGAKVTLAQQAAQAVAEAAGLDSDGLLAIAQVLKKGTGDANTLRLFAAVGEMMGEDSLPNLLGNGAGLSSTPAEARAELEAMMGPDSEYSKAVAAKRGGKPGADAEFKRLHERRQHLEKMVSGR
ncbi:hypothetical protein [Pseudooceanicola algae]|uniref:Uncharacterized protein n=1 Tax=Pseudooceanicola algae TaxID=1537215 RepID=A0A418SK81_9RHOB|nr:hypothetical protein [Pseudooceanicola algae]QPM89151.1 hypothetical protein PSAL_003620 [Pseudooceanicola algae]